MDSFAKQISDLLRNRLNELNMTNAELADEINVSRSSVGDWVAGISIPKADKVIPICNALKISLYQFFGTTDPSGLTPEDRKIIEAYKEHPEAHYSIKKILDLNEENR